MHFYPPQPINHNVIGTAQKAFWVLSWLTPGFPGVISRLKGIVKVILEGNFALILAVLTPPAASISVPNQKLVMANPPHA